MAIAVDETILSALARASEKSDKIHATRPAIMMVGYQNERS